MDVASFIRDLAASDWTEVNEPPKKPKQKDPGQYRQILVSSIKVNADINSRSPMEEAADIKALASSIREVGLITPISLTEVGSELELIAGFRRLRAVKLLGWEFIPAFVVDVNEHGARLFNFAENVARKDLRLYDVMRTIHKLYTLGIPSTRIASDTGMQQGRVQLIARVWPRVAPAVKEKWSRITDACYEPSQYRVTQWSALSDAEQTRAWREWSNDEDVTGEDFEEYPDDKPNPNKRRNRLRPLGQIQKVLDKLSDDDPIEAAQRRALLWAMKRRDNLK